LICAYHNVRISRVKDINKKNLNVAYISTRIDNINFDEASTGKFIISNKTTHACATITMNTLVNTRRFHNILCYKGITNIKFLQTAIPKKLCNKYKTLCEGSACNYNNINCCTGNYCNSLDNINIIHSTSYYNVKLAKMFNDSYTKYTNRTCTSSHKENTSCVHVVYKNKNYNSLPSGLQKIISSAAPEVSNNKKYLLTISKDDLFIITAYVLPSIGGVFLIIIGILVYKKIKKKKTNVEQPQTSNGDAIELSSV
jgi:hypothetical protein